jgi:hypothetical protein
VIAFDRSRGRGIVELEGRAVVVDASLVDASHLVPGDGVLVELGAGDRIVAVRVESAAAEQLASDTRGLFVALLDAQNGAPAPVLAALVGKDDLAPFLRAWLARWVRPIRFWEPNNVAELIDRRSRDAELTAVLAEALAGEGPTDRETWLRARLKLRPSC